MAKKLKKCRVLEICLGDFGTGGGGVLIWRLCQNMDGGKLQFDFFCFQQPEDRFIQEILKKGGNCWIRKKYKNKIIRNISEYFDIRKIVKKGNYDCVHIHFSHAYIEYLCFLASKKYANRVLCHSHNTEITAGLVKHFVHNLCKKRLHSARIMPLACSDDAAKWLFPPSVTETKQYTVIKNGIDAKRFIYDDSTRNLIRKRLGVDGCFVIGHVGRFAYQKNHEFLIDTFAKVKRCYSSAVLLLIGGESGENLGDGLKEIVRSLGLSDNVIFYGNTDRVNELYQAMDCFVFPSRYEGLGIAAIEAQAAGLKTLCSDEVPQEAKITDLLEYMPLSEGPEKWAEKILTYVNGYERKDMSEAIVAAGYDIKASAKQLENIYLSCHKENMRKS